MSPEIHRQNGISKALLRTAFADLLPEAIYHRPKHAFDIPISAWLRGPLRPNLETALTDASPLWNVLRPERVQEMARSHWAGQRDFGRELWMLLHLAVWWKEKGN
jgi:asparagine synthase (glutamine-hydrolysing)